MRKETITINTTIGQLTELLQKSNNPSAKDFRAMKLDNNMTVGQLLNLVNSSPDTQLLRDEPVTVSATIGEIIDFFGEENVRQEILTRSAKSNQKAEYETSEARIAGYWLRLILHAAVYVLLSVVLLEFIDKDKR